MKSQQGIKDLIAEALKPFEGESTPDKPEIREQCLEQHYRVKQYCKSVLRVISCDFNTENETGNKLSKIQHGLFQHGEILDTIFRTNKNSKWVRDGIINVSEGKFLGKKALISKFNKKTYLGKCAACKEMCGMKMNTSQDLPNRKGFITQKTIFDNV